MPPKDEQIFEANCGIGSDGFQPGNTCAKGGDGEDGQQSEDLPQNVRVSFDGGPVDESAETIEKFFGKPVSAQELAGAVGALDGSRVGISLANENQLNIYVDHKDINQQSRKIHKDENGKLRIENVSFEKKQSAGSGVGAKMLNRQVSFAQKLGIDTITTYAGGAGSGSSDEQQKSTGKNGYYTWARLGYNAPVDGAKLGNGFEGAKTLHDVFNIKGGAALWKQNGSGSEMSFDTRRGSQSVKRLRSYLSNKGFSEDSISGTAGQGDGVDKAYWNKLAIAAEKELKRRIAIGEPGDTPDDLDELDEANMTVKQTASEPGQAAVHVPAPMGDGKKTAKKKTPNSHFMQRMIVSMMERYTEEEIAAFKKTAAAHAGGMTKAERAKLAAMNDELYKESLPAECDEDDPDDDTETGKTKAAACKTMSEGSESLTAMLREIETAFRTWAQIPNQKPGEWPDCKYWCREVFSDYVIAEDCKTGELCKIPFQENAADGYDFGMPVEVEISYVPVTASEVGDLCADGNGWRLFVEHDFAEAPDWMPLLPKPGKYKHPKYGEIKLTKARNANFADGVNKKIYQSSLPINTEHAPSNEGAFGWIEEARQNDDGSIDARVSWTDLGKEAIEKDRFRFISPEWADECESPDGKKLTDVIRGAAMTVRPFFKDKHLRPLVASERGLETLDHALPASDQPQLFFFTALLPSEPASQPGIQTYKEPTPMAEKEKIETPPEAPVEKPVIKAAEPAVDAQKFAELETKLLALEAENTANKQAAEIQAAEVKKLSEANAKLTDEAETLKFTEEVEGKSKGNKHAYVGEFAKHVAHMKSLAKAFGEDSEEIKFYMETQRQSAALAESSLLFAEKGRGGAGGDGTPWGKIVGLAKAKMESDKALTEPMAISLILKEQPQLYAEYQAAEGN